ncbi:PAS domain S-box protein [Rhodopila globiformis]|uniref:histidine kinase n=1 Tax=Rhodopila globiformis TaxID=1071 RepID=A0A2S6NGI4_RHOGL|nr:PAS domain S-box protein [Rhodopila globiformis]PPQ33694.1 hypothetical protein CCS01_13555 [Rhodopila globiformis]
MRRLVMTHADSQPEPPGPLKIFSLRRRATWGVAAIAVLVMAMGLGARHVIRDRERSANEAVAQSDHAQALIATLGDLLIGADDAETGQRGFLLTGKPAYLGPYHHGIAATRRAAARARDLVAGNPRRQDRLRALETLLYNRQAVQSHTIDLAQAGDRAGAVAVVNTDEGQHLMDAIRATVAGMVADEQQVLQQHRAERQRSQHWSGYLLAGLLAAAAGGMALGAATVAWLLSAVTARKDAAAAADRRRLLAMMDLAAIMVRDLNGTIRFWSAGCQALYGYTAGTAVGQSSHALLQTVFPVPLAEIEAALLQDGHWSGELRHRRQDGAEVTVIAHKAMRREPDGRNLVMENVTDITDLRRAEAALRINEARLRLVQAVGGVAYTDQRSPADAALVSPEYARLYGLPPGQTHISVQEWAALVHPDDEDRLRSETGALFAQGGSLATEFRIRRPNGAVHWIAMRVETFPHADGTPGRVVSAHRDITEIVRAREEQASRAAELERLVAERTAALAEAEARFRAIFDSQFQMIGLLDPDGTVLEANQTACEITGLAPGQFAGRRFWDGAEWPDTERARLRQDVSEAAAGTLIRREVRIVDAGGHGLWIDFSLKPVRDAAGRVVWIIPEGRDITERRSLSSQLAQAQKVQALGQLAGGIAHDFNNILQAVEGAATLIERRPEDIDKSRRLARLAIEATSRGASITRRLLSFARKGELRTEVLSTAALLGDVREVLAHTLGTVITVRCVVPPDVPPVVADRGQLETVLVNLGTNARDAMPHGGTLTLAAAVETVAAGAPHPAGLAPGNYVRLSAADTGDGMDAATLAQATEPFFTTKAAGQGTGLGLPMVKAFAEQSGGAMAIDSAPGAGTTVTLWLRQAGDTVVPSPGEKPGRTGGLDASARVLLVDDDDMVRETMAAQLEELGFTMLVASGGAEALALLEAGEVVDALVSDLSMPDMNGVTTIERARTMRSRLPCFLLTGYVGERAALEAEDSFTLVRKPVSAQALAARIEAALAAGPG